MKVAVNARTFHIREGEGAIQASAELVNHLAARNGVKVVAFGHPTSRHRLSADVMLAKSYYPITAPLQTYGIAWERTVLPHLAKAHGADVLFCPNGNGPLHSIDTPVVTCIHDVNAQLGMSSSIHKLYRKTTVPRMAAHTDRLITVSEFSKQQIVRVMGTPSEKITVIPNGIDPLYLDDSSGSPVDVPDDYILFVGSMNPRKNIGRLLEAVATLRANTGLSHEMIIAGPPNREIFQDMDTKVAEMFETGEAHHIGFVSDSKLKFLYQNAAVLAYPSLYEGFGLPPLEAMACGTAVLVSDRPPFTETIGDGGELVDPESTEAIANGLRKLLTDRAYRNEAEQHGSEIASNYTWEQSAAALKSVLGSASNTLPTSSGS